MFHNEKLKKVSDTIFQEAEPPKDRSRPLEWRRSLTHLGLDLTNVQVWDVCKIHETDIFFSLDDERDNAKSMATAQTSYSQIIKADVDQEKLRDTLLFAVPEEKNSEIYKLERPKGNIRLTIKAGDKHSYKNCNLTDVYPGSIGRDNFEPSDDGIWIEVRMPQEELDKIITVLTNNPKSQLKADIDVLAFTYEVDDALREWYHPRDMFINNEHSIALLSNLVASREGEIKKIIEYNDDNDADVTKEIPSSQIQHSKTTIIERKLNGIKNAIYVVAIILVIIALK